MDHQLVVNAKSLDYGITTVSFDPKGTEQLWLLV